MNHDVNLNIHYSAPKEIWEKIDRIYESMPYWAGSKNGPQWTGTDIDLWASVEPSGIQIAGIMPDDIWEEWYCLLKGKRQTWDRVSAVSGRTAAPGPAKRRGQSGAFKITVSNRR